MSKEQTNQFQATVCDNYQQLGFESKLGPRVRRRPPALFNTDRYSGGICGKNAARKAEEYIKKIESYPDGFRGRGIVTCAGGLLYNTCAWVLINMLRRHGCRLPIQAWYLGDAERDENWIELVKGLGVNCVDAEAVRKSHPHPRLGGWELKPYAILHCPFREVLFLDADNVPLTDPTYLFEDTNYRATGAIFWQENIQMRRRSAVWKCFGVPFRTEFEQESGQILIDKEKCWAPLKLCNWYNEHSDFYYTIIYGDKDTFRFAWNRLEQPYASPPVGIKKGATIHHSDMEGRVIFQHRCKPKWSLGDNDRSPEFVYEEECFDLLDELRRRWTPTVRVKHPKPTNRKRKALVGKRFKMVCEGFDEFSLVLGSKSRIDEGRTDSAHFWWIEGEVLIIAAASGEPTVRLIKQKNGSWRGRTVRKPEIAVQLLPK